MECQSLTPNPEQLWPQVLILVQKLKLCWIIRSGSCCWQEIKYTLSIDSQQMIQKCSCGCNKQGLWTKGDQLPLKHQCFLNIHTNFRLSKLSQRSLLDVSGDDAYVLIFSQACNGSSFANIMGEEHLLLQISSCLTGFKDINCISRTQFVNLRRYSWCGQI